MIDMPLAALQLFARSAQTLTVCWRVTKHNGTVLRGTLHQEDITIETGPRAGTYSKRTAIVSTDVQHRSDGKPSNLELDTTLRVDAILPELTVAEVEAGLYYQAPAELFLLDFTQPDAWQKSLVSGTLGEFRRDSDGRFHTELRDMASALMQQIVRTYSQRCNAAFGDDRCKFDVAAVTRSGVVTAVTSRRRFDAVLAPAAPSVPALPANPSFEDGDVGWVWSGNGFGTIDQGEAFEGAWRAWSFDDGSGPHKTLTSESRIPIEPGKAVTIRCRVQCGPVDSDRTRAQLRLVFFNAAGERLQTYILPLDLTNVSGHTRVTPQGLIGIVAVGQWVEMSVTGTGPAGTVSWAPEVRLHWLPDGLWLVDAFSVPTPGAAENAIYYNGGRLRFTSGANAGFLREAAVALVDEDDVAQIRLWDEAPADVAVGDTFTLEPGCDHTYQTCRYVHNNLLNFRGFGIFAAGKDALMRGPADAVTRVPLPVTEEQIEGILERAREFLEAPFE